MGTFVVRKLEATGDISGGFGMNNFAGGSAAVAQKVLCRLRMQRGEWYLNPDAGMPWVPNDNLLDPPILGQVPPDMRYAEFEIKACILGTPDVLDITDFSLDYSHTTRHLVFSASGRTVDGDVWNIQEMTL